MPHSVAIIRFSLFLRNPLKPKSSEVMAVGQRGVIPTERWRPPGPLFQGCRGAGYQLARHHALPMLLPPLPASPNKSFHFHGSLQQTRISDNSYQDPFHPWGFSGAKRQCFPPRLRSLLWGPRCWVKLCFEITAERGARGVSAGNVRSWSRFLSLWNTCKLVEKRTVVVSSVCVCVCVCVLHFQ